MKHAKLWWIASACAIVLLQILAVVAFRTFFRGYRIPSVSMSPTIKPGESVIVRRTSDVRAGDIVAFQFPQVERISFVGRVIATGGETVQIRDKRVFINGKGIIEPYAFHEESEIYPDNPALPEPFRSRDQFGPFVVPAGKFFTLGDNREHSNDGRYWGPVPAANVIGRVVVIYSLRGFRRPPASSRIAPALPPK